MEEAFDRGSTGLEFPPLQRVAERLFLHVREFTLDPRHVGLEAGLLVHGKLILGIGPLLESPHLLGEALTRGMELLLDRDDIGVLGAEGGQERPLLVLELADPRRGGPDQRVRSDGSYTSLELGGLATPGLASHARRLRVDHRLLESAVLPLQHALSNFQIAKAGLAPELPQAAQLLGKALFFLLDLLPEDPTRVLHRPVVGGGGFLEVLVHHSVRDLGGHFGVVGREADFDPRRLGLAGHTQPRTQSRH